MPRRPKNDKRRHARYTVSARSQYAPVHRWSDATVDDLSNGGARLTTTMRPEIGTTVLLALPPDNLTCGSVVRHTEDGFAVAFAPLRPPARMN